MPDEPAPPAGLTDVLLVGLDDVSRSDSLLADVCPNLAALRASGLDFPLAFSNPICSQARVPIEFGALGRTLGFTTDAGPGPLAPPPVAASWPTLAGQLAAAGMVTARVGKWHCGGAPSGAADQLAPCERGYGQWLAGSLLNLERFRGWTREDAVASPPSFTTRTEQRYATLVQVEEAAAWWASHAGGPPRFLHVALNEPHGPLQNPPAELLEGWPAPTGTSSSRERFLAKLRAADTALGRLLSMAPNAFVLVYSDNGTAPNSAAPEVDPEHAKTTTYDPGIQVVHVARWPGCDAGTTFPTLVHLVDLPVAILERLGVDSPDVWDGQLAPRTYVICEATRSDGTLDQAARTWRYKLRAVTPGGGARVEQFFDLVEDPGEVAPLEESELSKGQAQLLAALRLKLYSSSA